MDFEKKNKTKQINKLKTLRNSRTVCRYVQLHNVSVMTINQLWLVEFKSDLIEFFHHFMNSLSTIKNVLHDIHNFCTVLKISEETIAFPYYLYVLDCNVI